MIISIHKRRVAVIAAVFLIGIGCVAATSVKPTTVDLPILMYHHLSEREASLGAYVVKPEQFRNDLLYLKSKGYQTVTTSQLLAFSKGKADLPSQSVLITFDDGYESFYHYAFPILKELNMTAVLSVIGTYTEQYSSITDHNVNYAHVTWDEIAEMAQSGHVEIGNHTYNLHTLHDRKGCRIKQGENEQAYRNMLKNDILQLQGKVKDAIGKEPTVFTYPYGSVCSQGCEVVRQLGFAITLGCEEKVNHLHKGDASDLIMMKRYNRAHGKSSEQFLSAILKEQ